jgi:hypothetical protein
VISVGGLLLFGYNVYIGLRTQTDVKDVFSLHKFAETEEGFDLSEVPAEEGVGGFLADPTFVRQFTELYQYYKEAHLKQIRRTDSKLLAIFQVGSNADDLRVFRWAYDGKRPPKYMDDRGERDHVIPPQHDFEWIETTREHHVTGRHPHVSIEDKVFVETVGGDLTIKIEDNTDDGFGIYREDVIDASQSLDDGQISYAKVGTLILLKVLPYREEQWRYFVFNTRTETVTRIDAIGEACIQLPEDHGLIFPGGYYLQDGQQKLFAGDAADLKFLQAIKSPNGEDVLYVFFEHIEGRYVLLPYNLIRKEVANPIHCHGTSTFDDGKMAVFRSTSEEPERVHTMQIWQTPFTSVEFAAAAPTDGSFLAKVGNAELVRGISDALSIQRMTAHDDPNRHTYEDLIGATTRALDAYYWLENEEVGNLAALVKEVRRTAESIVDEYDKVLAIRKRASESLVEARERQHEITRKIRPEDLTSVELYMQALTSLRTQRGHLISLREMRYMDLSAVDGLEKEVVEAFDEVSGHCVDFLLSEEAFAPLSEQIDVLLGDIDTVEKATEIEPLDERLSAITEGLDLLSEIAGGLQQADATARTRILESISEVFAQLNRVRATLENKRKSLLGAEGRAEFAAQFKLLAQGVDSALARSDTPEECDDQLSRLMVQLEEIEGRFSEFDEFLTDLATKREEIYDAFSARKQTLMEERQRRAQNLMSAGERILGGAERRARTFKDTDQLNAYFASDPMLVKLRSMIEQLNELGDSVKADELSSRLKAARQNALRIMRDKSELFEDGANVIKLGKHRFSVNTQQLELTMVPRQDDNGQPGVAFHLTGTNYYEQVSAPEFLQMRDLWEQSLVSESKTVSRSEYLAAEVLAAAEKGDGELTLDLLNAAQLGNSGGLLERVRGFAADRYDEGYERGIHDSDAAAILDKLLTLRATAGLLRFPSHARALAALFWYRGIDEQNKARFMRRAGSLAKLRGSFGQTGAIDELAEQLAGAIAAFIKESGIDQFAEDEAALSGAYLCEELCRQQAVAALGPGGRVRFTTSTDAAHIVESLTAELERMGSRAQLRDDLELLADKPQEAVSLAMAWIDAYLKKQQAAKEDAHMPSHLRAEAAVLLLTGDGLEREMSAAAAEAVVEGLLGQHANIVDGKLEMRLDEFTDRLGHFRRVTVPRYRRYRKLRQKLIEEERERLRLEEFKPRVLTSFVRNKLISEVYLPVFGDNLAKQLGTVGDSKRTDLMGLLLLVSPPGYGKTTLMEYLSSQLGLVFMKVNGPSLGHSVVSLDPSEAPNATARQEVEKINLALEMGNNVMLYLDDIQHTNPELLQKFISLCDGQRRIEGVWKGKTQTYDLRGRKFCMVMAGNPYTESGEKFQIPDMLSNRADTYNLGDILEGKYDTFALSYLENSITSNPTLAPMASRSHDDIYLFVRMAQGEQVPTTDLSHPYSGAEVSEIVAVLSHMFKVQNLLLQVNQTYISSAAQDDAYRTEPKFQLQGSYRNMNKLAEKVVPAMNEKELQALIGDHYNQEAQTLTTGAESNLLKLGELRGTLDQEQAARWHEIKDGFQRKLRLGGSEEDPAVRVVSQLGDISDRLNGIQTQVQLAAKQQIDEARRQAELDAAEAERDDPMSDALSKLGVGMARFGAAFTEMQSSLTKLQNPHVELKIDAQLPTSIADMLDHQVALVERILTPLVNTVTRSLEEGDSIRLQVVALIDDLKRIEQRLKQLTPEQHAEMKRLGIDPRNAPKG